MFCKNGKNINDIFNESLQEMIKKLKMENIILI